MEKFGEEIDRKDVNDVHWRSMYVFILNAVIHPCRGSGRSGSFSHLYVPEIRARRPTYQPSIISVAENYSYLVPFTDGIYIVDPFQGFFLAKSSYRW